MSALVAARCGRRCYHILRDRRTLPCSCCMPVVQVILFGYAIRTDVDDVRLAIVDPAPDATTLALRSRFAATRRVSRRSRCVARRATLDAAVPARHAQVAVVFEPGFGERLARGDAAQLLDHHRRHRAEHRHARAGYVTRA